MEETFKKAQEYIKKADGEVDNETKLKFYAWFKQVKEGPAKGKPPSRLKVIQYYKYQAHKSLGDMTKQQAMAQFIQELTRLHPHWNTTPKL